MSASTHSRKRPLTSGHPGGKGVSAQRLTHPGQTAICRRNGRRARGKRATAVGAGSDTAGLRQPRAAKAPASKSTTRPDLVSWFRAIQERLKGVIVLNRSWESALDADAANAHADRAQAARGHPARPAVPDVDRQSELYGSDADGSSSDVATAAYAWAIANGDRFRIAYCCHEGDFPVPDGWTFITASFGGVKDAERRASRQDMVMFSPLCVPDEPDPQMTMFDLLEE